VNNKDGHGINEHNPLKSSYDSQRLSNVTNNDANDCSERLFESVMNNQEEGTDGSNSDIDYRFPDFNNNSNDDSYDPNEQLSTAVSKVQIKLNNLINNHKASLKLYDDIVDLFNDYISSPNFEVFATLKRRKSFMKSMETSYRTRPLRPMNTEVILHDGTCATVPIFDAKAMILDLLTNPNTMNNNNIAEGYDVFTGDVDPRNISNNRYGEIHTGDEWLPARNRFCHPPDDTHNDMPVGLVIFGDKSHTDLHGALALTPIIFTLTLFNRSSRNNTKFWRPLGYIPNLSYGKNKADKTETKNKIQDEHKCLSVIFESIRNINRSGGFKASVMDRDVNIKVWIHFFIGDTEGNNKWLGHYPGSKRQVHRPYRDCKCDFNELSNSNPTCVYTTLEEMRDAKRLKRDNEKDGLIQLKEMSRYDIKNALTEKYMPLSDMVHGPYFMMPPKTLHTSGSGIIKNIFESLQLQIGGGRVRDDIDRLHVRVYMCIKRQSERDFPRGSLRNGIIDSTKCQSEERKGNLFLLLCIANTNVGSRKLQDVLGHRQSKWKKWIEFIKLYLSMEEWFNDCNEKEEVNHARPLIAKVLKLLKWLFPREDNTNGYCIPKFHGMTKFQTYMKRYGSSMNFYGGTGESAHKLFVKAPGLKTQRRVNEFAIQTSQQYYHMLVTGHALRSTETYANSIIGNYHSNNATENQQMEEDNVIFQLSGKYTFAVTKNIIESMNNDTDMFVSWKYDDKQVKKNNTNYCLDRDLVQVIMRIIRNLKDTVIADVYEIEGYTRLTTTTEDGNRVIYYAHPYFQGRKWHDWAYVHFEEINASGDIMETYYPSKILGFVTLNGTTEAVIQCSEKPVMWTDVQYQFFVMITIGTDIDVSYVTVPISSLVHPLCVIPDYGGHQTSYIVILPKRNWSRFFGERILSEYEKSM